MSEFSEKLFDQYGDVVDGFGRAMALHLDNYLEPTLKKCQSPIERKMLWGLGAMLFASWPREYFGSGKGPVCIVPQYKVGKYRLDFLIVWRGQDDVDYKIGVECDGHDYHERTKHQAQHDKFRDREILRHGITTIRFTGSEIHNGPADCAAEVLCLLKDQMKRAA